MNGATFQKKCMGSIELTRRARQVIGVPEGVSRREIRRAWRKRCLETHPDRNPGDPDAERRFRLVNCAYRLLTDGTPCDELMTHSAAQGQPPSHSKYDLTNTWGFYLWWRERFF